MGKKNSNRQSKVATNKHVTARLTYLQRSARYLSIQPRNETKPDHKSTQNPISKGASENQLGSVRYMISHMRSISRKAQSRLPKDVKRSICKCCDTILIPGDTATVQLENLSRGSKKPWADVSIVTCKACGTAKRFPVGARKQLSKSQRSAQNDLSSNSPNRTIIAAAPEGKGEAAGPG